MANDLSKMPSEYNALYRRIEYKLITHEGRYIEYGEDGQIKNAYGNN